MANDEIISFSSGDIPALKVEGKTLPEAWEKSLVEVWSNGIAIKTQYDRPNDPPSRDATMMMVIHEPSSEPRIHRALPTGLDELEVYRQEVVLGIHDHWIGGHGWSYSYHDRLFNYKTSTGHLDQVQKVIDNLADCFYTRRAQAITWDPELDASHHEPPCLQRMWFRIIEDPQKGLVLNMNTHWRSRDAFKAAFMNIFALTDLQKDIAKKISAKIGKQVNAGRYVDVSDSYHIYGSYFDQFKGFLETLKTKTFEQRTYETSFALPFFEEARKRIES
ncbi:MAG: thymidylate synthase [Actinobacteria bacterium ADurb.Bin346]|nr:MAG: thymidylate synthase [Actinobacteria bacterium ADurb.Bin346]